MSDIKIRKSIRTGQMKCFICSRRKCYTKIICVNPPWEYAACNDHINKLEKKADTDLGNGNGVMRSHISSSSPVKWGDI